MSGLAFEVVWTRMLTTLFGNTVFATSTVLAAYMTGLALGSYFLGRVADRRTDPLRIYALLEAGIGVSAVVLTAILWRVDAVSVWVQRGVSDSWLLLVAARYAVSFGLLVLPTCLMGGTLPMLSRFVVERDSSLGRHVGGLYALNTLGAALGCYVAGFLLIGRIGLNRTVWLAAAVNVGVAAVAWWLHRGVARGRAPMTAPAPESQAPAESEVPAAGGLLRGLVLGAVGLSGFAALGYEVVWTRALVFALGNSVYAFSTMLTTFLVGLALGSMACTWLVDRLKHRTATLGLIEASIGVYGIACAHLLAQMIASGAPALGSGQAEWAALAGSRFIQAFRILLLPTLLMGAVFPLAARIYTLNCRTVGRSVGSVYSVNTVGSVLGSVLTAFVLIPLLGLQKSMLVLGLINVGVGLALCAAEPHATRSSRLALMGVAGGALVVALLGTPDGAFRRALQGDSEFIYYKEEVSGTVWIEKVGAEQRLVIDQRDVAGTDVRVYDSQKVLGHLPMLLHPHPKAAFVLGFGGGGTCYSVSTHPEVERIDSAEFCPAVVEAAALLPEINGGVLDDPRMRLVVDDGRNVLLTTKRSYDVISVDLLYPDAAGTGALYTREFYETCRSRLNDGGLLAAWVPPHLLSMRDVKTVLATCRSVFPHTALWHSPYLNCVLMTASEKPFQVDFQRLTERMSQPTVRADLERMQVTSPYTLAAYFIAADEALDRYVGDVGALNTDDLPIIEYSAPRAPNEHLAISRALLDIQQPILSLLTDLGETEEAAEQTRRRLLASFEAMQSAQRAAIAQNSGDLPRAISECRHALELDPENPVARATLAQAYIRLGMAAGPQSSADEAISHVFEGLRTDAYEARKWIDRCNQVLRLNPDHARTHFALGMALAAVGETEQAISHVRTALRLRPGLPGAAGFLDRLQTGVAEPANP